jgi:type IV secretion system protein VirB5
MNTAALREKTPAGAKDEFVELYGTPLVWNTRLYIALVVQGLVTLGLVGVVYRQVLATADVKPLVVGVDAIGRTQVLPAEALAYRPTSEVWKYFLSQFVEKHYGRRRARLSQDYPESLQFLEDRLRRTTIAQVTQDQSIEKFVKGEGDEVDITVKNVVLVTNAEPYTAQIEFEQTPILKGSGQRTKGERYVAVVELKQLAAPTTQMIPVNPLALQITYLDLQKVMQ